VAAPGSSTTYASVEEIRRLIEASGYQCTSWAVRPDPLNALEMADCSDAVLFSIHEDPAQVALAITTKNDLLFSLLEDAPDSVHLIGPNWLISCGADRDLCEGWIGVVGGRIHVASPPATIEFSPDDFAVELIVLENQCFNSAGALITVEPKLSILGAQPAPEQTLTVIYEIHGGESVETRNLEVSGGQYTYDESTISTADCADELSATVVDVLER